MAKKYSEMSKHELDMCIVNATMHGEYKKLMDDKEFSAAYHTACCTAVKDIIETACPDGNIPAQLESVLDAARKGAGNAG